jgi:hypothetical protein
MSIYNLPTSAGDLESINQGASRTYYQQVVPTRDVTTTNFSNGSIHLRWTNASNEWTYLAKSYFRIRFRLDSAALDGQGVEDGKGTAPSMNLAAGLFQSMEFRINGTTVSRCTNFAAQTDMFVKRLKKSGTALEKTSARTELTQVDDGDRKDLIGSTAGVVYYNLELCWQPLCLGIFDIEHALPVGDYEIVLNPQTSSTIPFHSVYQSSAGTFGFQIDDMYLYLHQSESKRMDNGSYFIDLDEYTIQTEDVSKVALQQKHFQVPPSTVALGVAFQDGRTGTSHLYQPAKFIGEGGVEKNVNRFYLQYAGRSFPSPDADPNFEEKKQDRTTQRYIESILESGTYFGDGGAETIEEWQGRGQYYYFKVNRDGTSQDTRLTVNTQFRGADNDVANLRMLVLSQYKRMVKVTIRNSRVVSVTTEEV